MGKILYKLAFIIYYLFFKLVYRWQIYGQENLPKDGSLVVVSNHVSNLDPPAIGCIMNRQVHFMAKEELFKNPLAAWAFKKIGTFPVKRGRPDRVAIKKAFSILHEGNVLGIFPEGTRNKSGQLGRAKSGAIMIPIKTKTPILPIGIKYTKKNRLMISIGEVFVLENYFDHKLTRDDLKEAGELVMNKIKVELDKLG